jgi:hypothetical protein
MAWKKIFRISPVLKKGIGIADLTFKKVDVYVGWFGYYVLGEGVSRRRLTKDERRVIGGVRTFF